MMIVNGSIFDAVRQLFQSADDADEALRLAVIKIVDPDAWRKSFEPDETVDREPVPDSAPNEANFALQVPFSFTAERENAIEPPNPTSKNESRRARRNRRKSAQRLRGKA